MCHTVRKDLDRLSIDANTRTIAQVSGGAGTGKTVTAQHRAALSGPAGQRTVDGCRLGTHRSADYFY